ncbi:SIS domain-containing protein [Lachnospiraceae bacterium C1.1]|nr:SIS domain-containing protein [Lachnospiraceae bacterium C1.1]
MNRSIIKTRIQDSIDIKSLILGDDEIIDKILSSARLIRSSLSSGGKVLFCGNGGSASDSLHLTAEIVGRFQKERSGLAAISLNADVASMTAIANDYGYDTVFSRAVEGLMNPEDVIVGISTSGNSENVYQAILKAKEIGGKSIGLLGKTGGKIKDILDVAIVVPSDCTARIQESHIMIGHIICELIEEDY